MDEKVVSKYVVAKSINDACRVVSDYIYGLEMEEERIRVDNNPHLSIYDDISKRAYRYRVLESMLRSIEGLVKSL